MGEVIYTEQRNSAITRFCNVIINFLDYKLNQGCFRVQELIKLYEVEHGQKLDKCLFDRAMCLLFHNGYITVSESLFVCKVSDKPLPKLIRVG